MDRVSTLKIKLHTKRALTEKKIRQLEKEGKAGERYTAMISDINFLIVGLLCDVGWIIHLISEIKYLFRYKFHNDSILMMFFDILSLTAMIAVAFGIAVTIWLNIIHEKEIATRRQKNLSFGATIYGGLMAGVIGILQFIAASMNGLEGTDLLVGVIIGGFLNFAFGLPIFASFKKGIIYSDSIYQDL